MVAVVMATDGQVGSHCRAKAEYRVQAMFASTTSATPRVRAQGPETAMALPLPALSASAAPGMALATPSSSMRSGTSRLHSQATVPALPGSAHQTSADCTVPQQQHPKQKSRHDTPQNEQPTN